MDDDPPRYLEAYPLLNMGKLSGERWRGTWDLEWHDEFRKWIGSGVFIWRNFHAELFYEFSPTRFEPMVHSRTRLTIEPKYRGLRAAQPGVICRGCGAHVMRFFFKLGDWMCQTCQGLRNRSTFMTPVERYTLELNSLRDEVGDGRPDGMSNTAYFKAHDRIEVLKDRLGGRRMKTRRIFWPTTYTTYRYRSIEEPTDSLRNLPERRRTAILREQQACIPRGLRPPENR